MMEVVWIAGSDHCPAMKGIETSRPDLPCQRQFEKRPLPRNEGD